MDEKYKTEVDKIGAMLLLRVVDKAAVDFSELAHAAPSHLKTEACDLRRRLNKLRTDLIEHIDNVLLEH